MSSALVVIDVQNHFAVEKAADIPERIAKYIQDTPYEHVLFTQYQLDPSSNFHKILRIEKAIGSPGKDLHPALKPFSNLENTFEKLTFSAFKAPRFTEYLAGHGVTDLDICGINIDGCVLATAYEAFDLGYKVKILEELSSVSSDRQDYEDAARLVIARNLKPKRSKSPQ
jgi:nicotinamidase-related amidase